MLHLILQRTENKEVLEMGVAGHRCADDGSSPVFLTFALLVLPARLFAYFSFQWQRGNFFSAFFDFKLTSYNFFGSLIPWQVFLSLSSLCTKHFLL